MTAFYRVDITLDEPAILTDGSSETSGGHETFTAIPGTTILGSMAAALGIHPERESDLFARTFLSEATCFLNGYPLADGERTLPRPRTFRQGKFDRHRVIDSLTALGQRRSLEELRHFFEQATPADRQKSAVPAYVLTSSPGVDRAAETSEQVHVAIDRQRRAAERGVLFTYSSIPAGTGFRAVVTTTDATVASRLDAVCQTALPLRIGRSRGGGYGRATACLYRIGETWNEYETGVLTADAAIVTLLADYVPAFELPVVDAFVADMRRCEGLPTDATIEPVDVATRTVTGFRGIWGLPRAPRTAIQKGSVFVIRGTVDRTALQAIVGTGLGGRRNEGFGRIAIDWRIHGAEATSAQPSAGVPRATAVPPPTALSRPAAGDSQRTQSIRAAMQNRRYERQRRRFVEIALANRKTQAAIARLAVVSPAQFGNLRAAMASGLAAAGIGEWFADIAKKTAGDRWKRTRVPPLRSDDCRRNGVGFVWRSLLGGTTAHGGRSDDPQGTTVDFRAAVQNSLIPLCTDHALHEAALGDVDRTLRLFVIGLCSDVVRHRNMTRSSREQRS